MEIKDAKTRTKHTHTHNLLNVQIFWSALTLISSQCRVLLQLLRPPNGRSTAIVRRI